MCFTTEHLERGLVSEGKAGVLLPVCFAHCGGSQQARDTPFSQWPALWPLAYPGIEESACFPCLHLCICHQRRSKPALLNDITSPLLHFGLHSPSAACVSVLGSERTGKCEGD